MQNILSWFFSHPFTLAFLLVAMITRKDLAIYCFLGSLSSAIMWDAYPYHPISYAVFAGINTLLVIFSAWYNSLYSTTLSKAVMVLCTIGAFINGWQLIEVNTYNNYASLILGTILLLCLTFMDGRKGLLHGLCEDMRLSALRHVHLFSRKSHNGISR